MSKNGKQLEPSIDSGRPITPILRTRRTNVMLNPTPSSSKLMIGKQDSPYSQIQSITKTRSSSNLKNKSPLKFKNVSPHRSSNHSIALKSSESKRVLFDRKENTTSKQTTLNNSYGEHTETNIDKRLSLYQKESTTIEIKLHERLNQLQDGADSAINNAKALEIYQQAFDEVITKDKIFSSILSKIKGFYEHRISKSKGRNKDKEYKEKIKEINRSLNAQIDINKSNERKLEKIVRENIELSKSLDRSEEICTEMQKKLVMITNYNVSEVPKDEIKWKALLLENKSYVEGYELLKDDIKNYKYKEKKLLQLILALKQRGYPVEEVYESEVDQKRHKPLPNYSGSDEIESNSEAENLVSGRAPTKEKPNFIPSLNLLEVEPESISSSSFDSEPSSSS